MTLPAEPDLATIRQQLAEQGYAVVEDVLDPARVLNPLVRRMLRRLGEGEAGGAGTAPANGAGAVEDGSDVEIGPDVEVERRLAEELIRLVAGGADWPAQALDVSLPQGGVRPDTPMLLEPEAWALLSDPDLLDLVEALIGPTIWVSPVGHTREKVPERVAPSGGILGRVPWHQDHAVLLPEADDVDILTVWVPLVDTTVEGGCLQIRPTARTAELLPHCPGPGGLAVPESELPDAIPVPLPMRRGSVLLMHPRTLHASLPNRSHDRVRLSVDMRFQPVAGPTGRPQFPSFLVRDTTGARRPATFAEWRQGWLDARARTADRSLGAFNRWDPASPLCA